MPGGQLLRAHERTVDLTVEPAVDDALGDECEAFLSGCWVDDRLIRGVPVPSWAWLNQVAHGDLEALRAAAARPAGSTPSDSADIQALLARALLAARRPEDLCRVQRQVLIPLELRLMGAVVSPRRVVELVTTAVFGVVQSTSVVAGAVDAVDVIAAVSA